MGEEGVIYRAANGRILTTEELSEYRDMFNLVDKDGGGSISKEELSDLMNLLGIKKTPEELDADMAEIDADGSGDVDFDEFVAVMSKSVNTSYTAEQVRNAFKVFEVPTHPGYIKAEHIIKALMTYGTERCTREEAEELTSQLEADPNGLINYEEYIRSMMND
jgi:calmodulin